MNFPELQIVCVKAVRWALSAPRVPGSKVVSPSLSRITFKVTYSSWTVGFPTFKLMFNGCRELLGRVHAVSPLAQPVEPVYQIHCAISVLNILLT